MKTYNLIYKDDERLKNFLKKIPQKENLIQIFSGVTDKNKIRHILNVINKIYKNANIIGSTTDGEISGNKVTEKKIIISVSVFENSKVKTVLMKKDKKSFYFGIDFAKSIITKKSKVLITFADGLKVNGEEFLKGIESVSGIIVAGGLAGDNAAFKKTLVFDKTRIEDNAVVGAVIEGDIIVNNEFGFNWEGIGKSMTVNKSVKNRVYEIDGKTPVEIYKYYFGDVANDVVKIGVQFPLIVKKGNIKMARAVIGQNNDGSLIFTGNINEGDEVQFGFGDVSSILEKDKTLFDSLNQYDIESVFIYSCMARKRFLGKHIKNEIVPFTQIASVSGFFTYGEFFTRGENYFFNETMTVLMLSENERKNKVKYNHNLDKFLTLRALTNLIKTTSQELTELNMNLEKKVKDKTKEILHKNKELEYMYYHDQLTNLPNKHMLDQDMVIYEIQGVILIDIKHFSKINDLYGEFIGDEILKDVVKKLKRVVDEENMKLYRVGADQFIILIYEKINFKKLTKEIMLIFEKDLVIVEVEGSLIALDLDIRIAVVDKKYDDMKLKADLALHYAKRNSIDCVIYESSLNLEERLKNELNVLNMVKQAIKEDRVIPVFQKIEKKDSISFECLVRLKEDNKLIPPGYFLDVIQPTHYYFELTKIMIEKSFRIFSKRKESISLNFSFKDIENDEIVKFLINKIEEFNMKNRVIIEILESENIKYFEKLLKFIEKVKIYGVKIAIDDFGSGYSNFVYLSKLNPDFIKIDGSLIKNIHTDKNLYIITKNINNFAKELQCNTVAEYVSNEKIYNKVKEIGVDGVQGYFIDKPKENI